jgi:hypothetical protein
MTAVSLREIARRWDVEPSYVSKFLKRVGISAGPGGKYDYAAATAAREQHTLVGTGIRKRMEPAEVKTRVSKTAATALWPPGPQMPGPTHRCDACGCRYNIEWNSLYVGGDRSFCTSECRDWHAEGWSRAKIRRELEVGYIREGTYTEAEVAELGDLALDWSNSDGTA